MRLMSTPVLASGLLWISELIEEHSKLAKIVGIRSIYVSAPNHTTSLSLTGGGIVYSGNYCNTHHTILYRRTTIFANYILYWMSSSLSSEFLFYMAFYCAYESGVCWFVYRCDCEPFPLVLPFCGCISTGTYACPETLPKTPSPSGCCENTQLF